MLATWNIQHKYCIPCRALHSDRGDLPACEKEKKEFMSRNEALETGSNEATVLVNDLYCEVIHDKPFELMYENFFAFELIDMTHALSLRQKMEFEKNKKQYVTHLPTLSAIDKALELLHPEEWDHDKLLLELDKVFMIHNSIIHRYTN